MLFSFLSIEPRRINHLIASFVILATVAIATLDNAHAASIEDQIGDYLDYGQDALRRYPEAKAQLK